MNKIELHKFLKHFGSFMVALVLGFYVIPAQAQVPYSDSFKGAKPDDLIISGAANGATLTSGLSDLAEQGYLRLTNNQRDQSGYVQSTRAFPTADGLSISFEYFTYGGTGGDGITFFLYDALAANSFNIGATGGSLGYAQNTTLPGVSKGFLALGLDEFGNFGNPTAGRVGGPGRVASSVVLRGDGNGLGTGDAGGTNYKYLIGISTNNPTDMTSVGAGGIFHVAGGVDRKTLPAGMTALNTGYRKAKIDMVPNGAGDGFILNVWITEGNTTGAIVHQVIKNFSYKPIGSIPENLSFGFAASTGDATNSHEIRNLEIIKPVDPLTIPTLANVSVEELENVDLEFKSDDFISKFSQAQSKPLTKIKIQNLPKYGVLKLTEAPVTVGQEISVGDIPQLKFIPEADFSGTSSFQWNGSDGTTYAASDAFVNIKIVGTNPSFPYLESFMKSNASGLIKRGTPNPAELTSGTKDPTDAGYLRLTNNQINQKGYAYSTKSFPTDNGLSISFDYYMHGASGSDGISFFLYDAAANPFNIGAFGGSLGYTQNDQIAGGVSKAFIGLAIDEFGNFSNTGAGRQGGVGNLPGAISLRGDGDGNVAIPTNYEYLTHIQTNNAAAMSAIGFDAGSPFELSGKTDGRTAGITGLDPLKTGYRRLKMEFIPNGSDKKFKINVWITEGKPGGEVLHQVIKDYEYTSTTAIPTKLRYGFSAGNGNFPTIYEIRNLEILLPSNIIHKPILKTIQVSGFEDQELIFKLSDFEKNFFDPTATKSLKNIEFTSLPLAAEGILKLNGIDVAKESPISVADINSGKLKFIPANLDFNGKITSFKWNGYTTKDIEADLPEDVSITLNPVNDAPQSEAVEILIGSKENVLAASNFRFTDPKDNIPHVLKAVKITSIPDLGLLKLDNAIINAGQLIDINAIRSGKLTFTPGLNETGKPYTTFTFQVQDTGGIDNGGVDLSQVVYDFKINVAPMPVIELEKAELSICIGSLATNFNYTLLIGDPLPNVYSIDWDAAANAAGLIDVTDKDLLPGAVSVQDLSSLIVGTYSGALTVRNKNNDILSIAKPISISVKPLLNAEITYSTGVFCATGKTMPTINGDAGGKFTSSAGLIIDELTGELSLSESVPGEYIVSYSLDNGGCKFTATAKFVINAVPVIAAITGPDLVIAGSTTQLSSTTAGGIWTSSNNEVLTVNADGLVSGLKRGEATVFYTVEIASCVNVASYLVNVSPAKASDMSKIMNENKSIVFSSSEFYDLIDATSRVNDPSKSVINKIKIESLPSNGDLKLNGASIALDQELLFADLSGLLYTPQNGFSGTDVFKWNWTDVSGKYGAFFANLSIAVVSNSDLIQKKANENEVFIGKTSTIDRKDFTISGMDAAFLEINSASGEFNMKSMDFESPEDANSDNVYEFAINSMDNNANSYSENWRIAVQNIQEISKLSFEKVQNVVINENVKYTSPQPVLIGIPIGKLSYSLIGKDSILFNLDAITGIVSLEAKDYEFPTDSDKDNVYEIGWRVTDSDLNTATMNWSVRIANVKELSTFKMAAVSDVKIDEKSIYTSNAIVFTGVPIGKISYSLSGKDSGLFTINKLSGTVSMPARDFNFPLDWNKDNVYEVRLIAKDYDDNQDSLEWRVSIQRIPSSAAQSVLSPDSIKVPLDKNNPQTLTVTTKYSNGDNYLKGGELVVFNKISGSATISEVTDHGNGTYTTMVNSDSKAGSSVFEATLAGNKIMNGSSVPARVVVDFFTLGDNRLKDLSISRGKLSPQFNPDIFDYSASVGYFIDFITISPALIDLSAKIKINGILVSLSDSKFKMPLKTGDNIISILITAKDGVSQRTYTINVNRFSSSIPHRENFMNNIGDGLVFGGFPNQAKLTSGTIDEAGKGYLRLTGNKLNETGYVYNAQKFSSAKGLSISFEYFSFGGTGGNGLSFFLFDALADFNIGASGGSLGYAQSSTSAGLSKGFIGLGLDEFGEFSNTTSSKQGGPGRRPSSVVLRGDGDGRIGNLGTNYEYLSGLQTTDVAVMKVAGAGNKFSVFGKQDGRAFESGLKGSDVEGYRKAKIELVPMANKPGFIVNVWITEGTKAGVIIHHIIKNYSYIPTEGIPMDLKYGFAANSGNSTNIYEVRNIEIDLPNLSESPDLKPDNGEGTIEEPVDSSNLPLPTNLITPNGDGINDTWVIRNIEDFSNNTIRIFNRSGQEIYKTDHYNNDWDGRNNGNLLPKGTYYYIIEIANSQSPFKGHITIL